ncbi:MAG: amidohydrolase, partial [Candidatus Hydrogenedentes bacterium]|nr:amidohydrolase [Candidatus Hydrogenedentota bacterium]
MSSKDVGTPHSHTPIPFAVPHPDLEPSRRTFLSAVGAVVGTALGIGKQASAQAPETPTQAIARIVAERRIINVHEHVQGKENTDALLREMDALGIGRTVLLGSPWFTIALYEQAGFTRYDENNAAIVAMAQAHPERFEAWPTVNPLDGDKVEKIKAMVGEGASGVKLYFGHGYTATRRNSYIFHSIAMDDSRMMELYEYLSEIHIPVCYHVNPAKPGFMDAFVTVLRRFPDLKVNTPHFMLSSMVHSRLREMFAIFPNLVVDISFGHDDYLKTGLQRISDNPTAFRRLLAAFPERFLFGTDYVVTALRPHNHDWYA